MPFIYQQKQIKSTGLTIITSKSSDSRDPPAPSEDKDNKNCGDEWIERHSNSSDFVKELLKKFQPNGFQNKLASKQRPVSEVISSAPALKLSGSQNKIDNHGKSQFSKKDMHCSKNISSIKSQVALEKVEASCMSNQTSQSDISFKDNHSSSSLLSLPQANYKNSGSSPNLEIDSADLSVSKLSSIFEPTRISRKPAYRKNSNEVNCNKINNNDMRMDYLSVLKPSKTSEWNRNISNSQLSSKSVTCLNMKSSDINDNVKSAPLTKKTRPLSFCDSSIRGPASVSAIVDPSDSGNIKSLTCSKKPNDNALQMKNLDVEANTLPRSKSIPKDKFQQSHQPSKNNGGPKEIVFRKPSDETQDEVPFFRLILRRCEHSDYILYEDKSPNCHASNLSPKTNENIEHNECQSPVIQQNGNATFEEKSRALLKEFHGDSFHKLDNFDCSSALNKSREDISSCSKAMLSDESSQKPTEVSFRKLKSRKTDHSTRKLEDDVFSANDINPKTQTVTSKAKISLAQFDSTSSSSLPSKNGMGENEETNSNSYESLQSGKSDPSSNGPSTVVRRMPSTDGLGSLKRRGVVDFFRTHPEPSCFLNDLVFDDSDFSNDVAAASCEASDIDDNASNSLELQSQETNRKQSKLDMTLDELHKSEINYIDKLELIEHFKSELLKMKALTDQEASVMFLNILDILKFHKEKMLPEFEKCATYEERCMGEIFDELAPKLIIYSECLMGFSDAMRAISYKEKKNTNFQKCVQEIQALPRCANLTLQNHMLNLVQRIPKYILLMKQYIRLLPPDAPDLVRAKNGLQSLQNVATCNNKCIKKREKLSFIARGDDKLELLCIECNKDVTRKYVRCTNCQKFYCKSCFSNRQSSSIAKLKFCISCLKENRMTTLKLKTESLKVKDGVLQVKKSKDTWIERWFVIDSSGKFYSISTTENDFDKIDIISLENARLRVRKDNPKYVNVFILHLKDNAVKYFRAPSKEEFDGWIEGFKSVLSEKRCLLFPNVSLIECSTGHILESET